MSASSSGFSEPVELSLLIKQGVDYRKRLEFSSNGRLTNLDDRTFKGKIMSKIGGVEIATLQFEMPDQSEDPGAVYIYIPAAVTSKMPVNPSPAGMRLLTAYQGEIEVFYVDGGSDRAANIEALVSPRAASRG